MDDYDVLSAIKEWANHNDKVLSQLSKSLIERKLFKIEIENNPFDNQLITDRKETIQEQFGIENDIIDYFFITDKISNQAYDSSKNQIHILYKDGTVKDIADASDHLNLQALSRPVVKYFMSYPKTSF